MIVLKFGGTSMADASTWKKVLAIVQSRKNPVLVVSATSGTTNMLIDAAQKARTNYLATALEIAYNIKRKHEAAVDQMLADAKPANAYDIKIRCNDFIDGIYTELCDYLNGIKTLGELTPRTLDRISSIGERLSSYLISEYAGALGMKVQFFDATDVIKTNADFGKAQPLKEETETACAALVDAVKAGKIPVTGGFYGASPDGEITTLGRGGSDYSAAIIGAAIKADAIEIWTDVSGMYTCDPRVVPKAYSIPHVGFNEAAELAYFGAKVLHPATILPAVELNIPVYILNTFEPHHPGTRISAEAPESGSARAIAFKKNITVITIESSRMLNAHGFLAKVFAYFEKHKISIDLISTSEVSVSMTVENTAKIDGVLEDLKTIGTVSVTTDQGMICLVGSGFLKSKGIASTVFEAVKAYPIRMISQGSSEINLSFVVSSEHLMPAVQALHKAFFE